MGDNRSVQSAAMGLAHELGHALQHIEGVLDPLINPMGTPTRAQQRTRRARIEADNLLRFETPIARELGEPTRISYDDHNRFYRMNNSIHFRTTASNRYNILGMSFGFGTRVVNHNQFPNITASHFISAPR